MSEDADNWLESFIRLGGEGVEQWWWDRDLWHWCYQSSLSEVGRYACGLKMKIPKGVHTNSDNDEPRLGACEACAELFMSQDLDRT